jgi:hypothetical protein
MSCGKFSEPADHRIHTGLPRMLQRSATERGEPRAEDHAGIDQICVRHDAFLQAVGRFVEQGQDQPVLHPGIGTARGQRRTYRFSFTIGIKALA